MAGAIALATTGAVMTAEELRTSDRRPSTTATLGGLAIAVSDADWMAAGHVMPLPGQPGHGQAGYQMPPQMMPGMPTGDDVRLAVPITLTNTGGSVRGFNIGEEFAIRGGSEAEPRAVHSDTFGELPRLAPGNAVKGILYFDVRPPAPADPPLRLEWTRPEGSVPLAVTLPGAPATHHG